MDEIRLTKLYTDYAINKLCAGKKKYEFCSHTFEIRMWTEMELNGWEEYKISCQFIIEEDGDYLIFDQIEILDIWKLDENDEWELIEKDKNVYWPYLEQRMIDEVGEKLYSEEKKGVLKKYL